MTNLDLKDLPRFDELDRAASRTVRGGIGCLKREAPWACPGEMMPPVLIRRGWGECPPIHFGSCGPVFTTGGKLLPQPGGAVVPL